MTKPNLFSALNAAIEQRGELMHVRQDVHDFAAQVTVACDRLNDSIMRRAKLQQDEIRQRAEAQQDEVAELRRDMGLQIAAMLNRLDAVIGEDPAEVKQAA